MSRLVHEHLEGSAVRFPDKVALLHGQVQATYAQINAKANQLAHMLMRNGLEQGARVLMVMENSLESVVAYYGIQKAGGVSVEVPDRSTVSEVEYFLDNCQARVCIFSRLAAGRLTGVTAQLIISPLESFVNDGGIHIDYSTLADMPDGNPALSLGENGLAAIVYTSGSTGRPKGVMLTHGNLCTNTDAIVTYLGLKATDRAMVILPFHYVYGKTLLNTHFASGGSIVINNRVVFPNAVVDEMLKKECTLFAGVPSTFAMLLNRSTFAKTPMPKLRIVTQAGGAMAPALTRRVVESIGQARLFVMYGATEASARLSYLPPERLADKPGSIGKAIPGVSLTVRSEAGEELPALAEGYICATGPNIMQGYWNDPEETAKALKPWGLVTGDLGYADEEGFIFLTGRKKEMLKVGGERISPKEIEDTIIASRLVHEAAVLGRPDELLYEVPEAFIVPIDPKTFQLDDVIAFVQEKLSHQKQPRAWHLMDSLPKKSSGKINKEALKP